MPRWGITILLQRFPFGWRVRGLSAATHSSSSRQAWALLTEGGQAQHGDQQGVVPSAAFIPGLSLIWQDVPVGRVIQIIHEGTLDLQERNTALAAPQERGRSHSHPLTRTTANSGTAISARDPQTPAPSLGNFAQTRFRPARGSPACSVTAGPRRHSPSPGLGPAAVTAHPLPRPAAR